MNDENNLDSDEFENGLSDLGVEIERDDDEDADDDDGVDSLDAMAEDEDDDDEVLIDSYDDPKEF